MKYKKYIIFLIFLIQLLIARMPDAVGYNGLVVSSNKYASNIGIDVLKKGGNAIDAAVAVSFALAVVHPGAGNIGGGGFMVIRTSDGNVTTIDFRETAPNLASRDMFLDDSLNIIPNLSWSSALSAGVPGSVAGMWSAHKKFGTENWRKLIKPAVNLAKFGFDLDPLNCSLLNSNRYKNLLSIDSEAREIFTKDTPFLIGEKFIQSDLANTLNRIALFGAKEFYEGDISDNIIKCMNRTGGLISKSDLKDYKPIERLPISFDYKGYQIHTMPPPSSGGIALSGILNQLENINLSNIPFNSSDYIHFISESERRVYADRSIYLGDPDFNNIPVSQLISDEYSLNRWQTVDSLMATPSFQVKEGSVSYEKEETTHFSVVDKWGNAVSVTTTINGWFGNGIVVDNCGFLLNNEMDDFSSKPGEPNKYGLVGNQANSIEPNKRMLSSMTPTIVENLEGNLYLVLGSPGGSTIITTVAQLIINVIDKNMNIKDAVEAPRFHHQWLPDLIFLEPFSFQKETIQNLNNRGHKIQFRDFIGEANCIKIDYIQREDMKNKVIYKGAGDSRRGASAIAY